MSNKQYALVVRKKLIDNETIERYAQDLSVYDEVDSYNVKLALKGYGLGMVGRGEELKLKDIGKHLQSFKYEWCTIPLKRPSIDARVVSSFKIHKDRIVVFDKNNRGTTVEKDSRILMVIASAKQNMIKNSINEQTYDLGQRYQSLIQSGPVIDIYVLPDSLENEDVDQLAPLRFLPGKFHPESLGKHNTKSVIQNMDRVARLFKTFVAKTSLEMDFGLFMLPGCTLDFSGKTDITNKKVLDSISTYGNYLLHLYQQSERHSTVVVDSFALNKLWPAKHKGKSVSDTTFKPFIPTLPPPPTPEPTSKFFGFVSVKNFLVFALVLFHAFGLHIFLNLSERFRELFYYWGKDRGLFFFALSLSLFCGSFKYLKVKRFMDNTPTSKARSTAMGMVELYGVAKRYYNLVSPASNTPCVYYRIKRYVRIQSQKEDNFWLMTSDKENKQNPFYLQDETGRVLVDPANAKINAVQKQSFYSDVSGYSASTFFNSNTDVRIVEELIPENSTIYVLGFAEPLKPAVKSISKRVVEKLRLIKQNKNSLMKYDANNDGRIDDAEWDIAREDMERAALEEALSEQANEEDKKEIIKVGQPKFKGLPFIISEKSEKGLTTTYKWVSISMFLGAVVFLATGLSQTLGLIKW